MRKKLNHPGFKTNVPAENAKLENFLPGMGSNEACLLPNTTQPNPKQHENQKKPNTYYTTTPHRPPSPLPRAPAAHATLRPAARFHFHY
jgi:hypothetical protein